MRRILICLCAGSVVLFAAALSAQEPVQIDTSGLAGSRYRLDLNRLGNDILSCYAKALEQSPQARGRIKVRVTIEPTGDTRSVEVLEDSLALPAVTQCATKKLQEQKWPKSNTVVFFIYTFQFAPVAAPSPTPTGG